MYHELTNAEMEEKYGPRHYTVYMLMFPNLKVYVGYTGAEPRRRWHSAYYGIDISNAIKEFGKKNISYFILEDNLTREEAHAREAYWIDFYDARNLDNGYNCLTGGAQKGCKANDRLIQRYREAKKKQYSDPAEREKVRQRAIKQYSDPAQREKDRMAQVHYPVICIETGKRFESMVLAEKTMNINHSSISRVCKGERHTAGGYHWKYAT